MDRSEPAMDAAPALEIVAALASIGHDLRNATSVLWTGTDLMRDAPAAELVEIAADLRAPAQLVQCVTDLFIEAARAASRQSALEPAALHGVVERAVARIRRGGIQVELVDEQYQLHVVTVPGVAERCCCAAALATGHASVIVRLTSTGNVEITARSEAPVVATRVADAAATLAEVLASSAGMSYTHTVDDDSSRATLAFTPGDAKIS